MTLGGFNSKLVRLEVNFRIPTTEQDTLMFQFQTGSIRSYFQFGAVQVPTRFNSKLVRLEVNLRL